MSAFFFELALDGMDTSQSQALTFPLLLVFSHKNHKVRMQWLGLEVQDWFDEFQKTISPSLILALLKN